MTATVVAAVTNAGLLGVTHAVEPDHVALVLAWLGLAWLVLGQTSFPPVFDAVGTVGVVLGLLGTAMAVGGLRTVIRTGEHDHGTVAYLKTGLVGALFTLSPPVSMMVFAATLFPDFGGVVVALAVCTYGVAITATMSAIGAGDRFRRHEDYLSSLQPPVRATS
ncbi:hypothetical protein [Haloarcula salinisoli]|uniref:Uncharacterized protein n=1 Tax=Haloarcula salinisoli TaxID=2487746 RepID=A0A8J7YAY8_9EURY|nr:hypothetical protein [Halomicroarcula salinisoli]MBX0302107.1 hypothetical protein [Halomicroarcula salinisoli]